MCKATYRSLLIILVFAMAALACVSGGDSNSSGSLPGSNGSDQMSISAKATATYGAEQFQIQLTAIAEQKRP